MKLKLLFIFLTLDIFYIKKGVISPFFKGYNMTTIQIDTNDHKIIQEISILLNSKFKNKIMTKYLKLYLKLNLI